MRWFHIDATDAMCSFGLSMGCFTKTDMAKEDVIVRNVLPLRDPSGPVTNLDLVCKKSAGNLAL